MAAAAEHGAQLVAMLLVVIVFGVIRWSSTHMERATTSQRFLALGALLALVMLGLTVLNAVTD